MPKPIGRSFKQIRMHYPRTIKTCLKYAEDTDWDRLKTDMHHVNNCSNTVADTKSAQKCNLVTFYSNCSCIPSQSLNIPATNCHCRKTMNISKPPTFMFQKGPTMTHNTTWAQYGLLLLTCWTTIMTLFQAGSIHSSRRLFRMEKWKRSTGDKEVTRIGSHCETVWEIAFNTLPSTQ